MLTTRLAFVFLLSGVGYLFAQRPTNPALMEPQKAPEMDYVAVSNPLPLPAGSNMGAPASVAFDAKGNLFVLYRGMQAFAEFDANGKFVRAFGDGLFRRTHGLTIDRDGNLWVTDVGAHDLLTVNSGTDAGLKRPTPLQVTADPAGGFRLYAGRRYVIFSR